MDSMFPEISDFVLDKYGITVFDYYSLSKFLIIKNTTFDKLISELKNVEIKIRKCCICNMILSFQDFFCKNYEGNLDDLVKIWIDERVEILCCKHVQCSDEMIEIIKRIYILCKK